MRYYFIKGSGRGQQVPPPIPLPPPTPSKPHSGTLGISGRLIVKDLTSPDVLVQRTNSRTKARTLPCPWCGCIQPSPFGRIQRNNRNWSLRGWVRRHKNTMPCIARFKGTRDMYSVIVKNVWIKTCFLCLLSFKYKASAQTLRLC